MAVAHAPVTGLDREEGTCRILVDSLADDGLTNAQMTNAREIILRLDPEQFHVAIFHVGRPDERIRRRPNTQLIALPSRLKTLRILRQFAFGAYDILFYLKVSPASEFYMRGRRLWRRHHLVVGTVESQSDLRREVTVPKTVARMWEQTVLRCDYLFSNSRAVKESLKREFGIESRVVATGVDCKFFVPPEERRCHPRVRVLFVGSLRPFKQPQLLLEAARRYPQSDFLIAGDGEMAVELKNLREREKLTNLSLLGALGAQALLQQYQQADIFLFPSLWEGSPKVILEAAACGLPVIARNDYQPETVVHGETGYLVPDNGALFARLEDLIQKPELRHKLGAAGRRHAETFDWDRIANQWAQVFLDLMPETRKP